jgi:hypothetical protein
MTTRQTTPPEPPDAAVNADAHWAATRERLRNRNRPTATLTICDDPEAKKALEEARFVVRRIEAEAAADPSDKALAKDLAAAKQTLKAAESAFDDVAIRLTFQALRRGDFAGRHHRR